MGYVAQVVSRIVCSDCTQDQEVSDGFYRVCSDNAYAFTWESQAIPRCPLQSLYNCLDGSSISHFSCHGFRNLESGKGGVYYDFIGEDPHRVYAMGMCINGMENTVCSDCIKFASEQLMENCPNHTEAFTWTPYKTLCFARYSYRPFLTTLDMHPLYTEFNSVDAKPNLTDFEVRWKKLVRPMISKAAFSTKDPAFSNRRYYVTDSANLKTSQAIYALMQCIPNLSPHHCEECLQETLKHYEANCRGKQGCSLAFASCFFRWDLYPFSEAFNQKCKIATRIIMAFVVPTIATISLLSAAVVVLFCRRTNTDPAGESSTTNSLQYDLKTIEAATCTFSKRNMLGKGGFGEVFKAVLPDGSEIAVKRLSKESAQGIQEFKNEASLVAKLQHKNLVRVLGFCMEGEEKILIYEFVPNKSLDYYLFEPTKQGQLDWTKRYEIIVGTAKGILYLHQDAPLKIIHRDLKASNIILDADMKPKIADFGMARILGMDQSRADTRRVVGTYGYIAPEYMMHGEFSTKSDVYSFGVIVLEIISGKKNSSFHETDESGKNLVTHAWRHWKDGTPLELVDAELGGTYESEEVIKCIHIALLCVQDEPEKRPPLLDIMAVLTSNSNCLPLPQSPPYEILEFGLPPINSVHASASDSLMSDFVPR